MYYSVWDCLSKSNKYVCEIQNTNNIIYIIYYGEYDNYIFVHENKNGIRIK